jgi:uncharacterized protein (TIGR00251 family)
MSEGSTRVRVHVSPGAGRDEVVGRHGDAWKVRVTAAAERGRANAAVLRVLSDALEVPTSSLTLVAGSASRRKVVELHGLDADEAARRLEERR